MKVTRGSQPIVAQETLGTMGGYIGHWTQLSFGVVEELIDEAQEPESISKLGKYKRVHYLLYTTYFRAGTCAQTRERDDE